MERVTAGQQWRPPHPMLQNAWTDAAEAHRDGSSPLIPQFIAPHTVVTIKNDTGSHLVRGDAIMLDDFEFATPDPDKPQDIWFVGKQPTTAHKPYAVLLEPIPYIASDKRFGRAQISGVCWAKISKRHDDHPRVHIDPAADQLATNWYGCGEILFKQEIDSQWWAVVNLGPFHSETIDVVVTETGGIDYDSSGTCDVWRAGAVTSPAEEITVHFNWLGKTGDTIAIDMEARAIFKRVEDKWVFENADC